MINNTIKAGILFGFLATSPAWADQTSPVLDELFEGLQEPATTPAQARALTTRIWNQWLSSDNADAERLMELGIRHMNDFALDEAARVFTDLIDMAPEYAEAWNKRATVFYMMGEFELSTEDVRETLKLEPRHFGALSGQGLIYMNLDRRAEALHWFRRALEVNPFMEGVKQNIEMLEEELTGKVI